LPLGTVENVYDPFAVVDNAPESAGERLSEGLLTPVSPVASYDPFEFLSLKHPKGPPEHVVNPLDWHCATLSPDGHN
jgi:hypothetical protein